MKGPHQLDDLGTPLNHGSRPCCYWRVLYSLVLLISIVASRVNSLASPSPPSKSIQIRVCTNKHCAKSNPRLLQTISNLVGGGDKNGNAVLVESSGCLSQCEKGPNMVISLPDKKQDEPEAMELNGIQDSTTAAVQLEFFLGEERLSIPKILKAASKVMEKVATLQDASEQERYLNSVIEKLQDSPPYDSSPAMAHAYALRSKVYLEQKRWDLAISDAQKVVMSSSTGGGLFAPGVVTAETLTAAFRAWADAELAAQEGTDQTNSRVLAVLQLWQERQPTYRTKLQREMQALIQKQEG